MNELPLTRDPAALRARAKALRRHVLRMAEIVHVGQFSGGYAAGRVDFRALNQDRPYGSLQGAGQFTGGYSPSANTANLNKDFAAGGNTAKQQVTLLQLIVSLLQQIAHNGGLN